MQKNEIALPLPAQTVPADVAALVVAAREASSAFAGLFEDSSEADALDALDKALEPFASRVCWDDEGGSLPEAHAVPCTCGDTARCKVPGCRNLTPNGICGDCDNWVSEQVAALAQPKGGE